MVSSQFSVYVITPRVYHKRFPTKGIDLLPGSNDLNIADANSADDFVAQLLIPAAKNIALSSNGSNDYLGRSAIQDLKQLRFVYILS